MKYASLDTVKLGDFFFKVSNCLDTGSICVVAYNPLMLWSHVKFFDSEAIAKNWIEYLVMQGVAGEK